MRISVIYPSPHFSVRDVARGYHYALAELGHDVTPIDLPKRLGLYEAAVKGIFGEGADAAAVEEASTRLAADAAVVECLRHDADLVLVVCGMGLHPDLYPLLRRAGIPTATVFTECPYQDHRQLPLAALTDACFVNDKASVQAFRRVNPRTWYLPPAHDPEIHRPVKVGPEHRSDVFLVGTGFGERVRLLEAVDWTGIDFRLYGYWELSPGSPLRRHYEHRFVPNDEVARWYSGAAICLNLHRADMGWGADGPVVTDAYSINPRAYEIAACGAFQLCDDTRPELRDVLGTGVATFRDAAELGKLIRGYLRPEAAAIRRIMAGDARARVKPHTFRARAASLVDRVREAGIAR